jgi:ubiquinone/menaquinone biosynthesis C-methylase UbiE
MVAGAHRALADGGNPWRRLRRCAASGSRTSTTNTTPTPHADRSSIFAEIEAKRYRYHYHLTDLFAELRATDLSRQRAIEIGCGIGIDTVSLARLGFREVVGVDLTAAAIAVARQRALDEGIRNVRYDTANAEALPFPDASFDCAYSFGVIHHTPSIHNALTEIHRVLVPGGRALIMIYHRQSLVDLVHQLFHLPYESPRNLGDQCPVVNRYTRSEARALFDGFTDIRDHTDYPFTYGMRHVSRLVPISIQRALGRAIGWHLMIDAGIGRVRGFKGPRFKGDRCADPLRLEPSNPRTLDPFPCGCSSTFFIRHTSTCSAIWPTS